eukprot:scaffold115_cov304-Prasinococcus_capsulatus_cf.AAC.16
MRPEHHAVFSANSTSISVMHELAPLQVQGKAGTAKPILKKDRPTCVPSQHDGGVKQPGHLAVEFVLSHIKELCVLSNLDSRQAPETYATFTTANHAPVATRQE